MCNNNNGPAKPSKELSKIVGLIDRYVDKGSVNRDNAHYVTGLISERGHADNGANSVLHPLTAIHFSDGKAPHYTLQSGWLQTLCLRYMRVINDDGLQIMASSAVTATKKSEVKGAQEQAFDKSIQSIDNIHFYPAKGEVATCAPTLGAAFDQVRTVLGKLGEMGRVILVKDDAFLATRKDAWRDFQLKESESPAWTRLKLLLDNVVANNEQFIHRGPAERRMTAKILLDGLTRALG